MQLVLTTKAQKLMKLCEIEGYKNAHDLMEAVWCDSVCPAICMTEGCDYTQYHVQRRGYGLRFKPGAGDGRKSSRTRIGCGEPKLGMDFGRLFRSLGVASALGAVAALIVCGLVLWLVTSIVSSTPIRVLKERAAIAAWIGIPAAVELSLFFWGVMSGASTLAISWRLFDFLFLPSLVWGNVFSALILGGRVRQRLSTKWKAPKALALPFATLGFTIIVTLLLRLYIDRGLPWTLECDSPPYPLLSACGVQVTRICLFARLQSW